VPGRFYVTTPIYYVNDAPHIGHAYTTVTADAIARWHRLLGDDVHFLTGTDEHGLKVAQSADAAGITPLEQADRYSDRFREAWELLGISYDDFIRTTEPRHHAAVQDLLTRVYERGDIELDTYEGPYCVSCEAYYTEAELVGGNCPIHTSRPVITFREDNWFFRLSRYQDRLLAWIEGDPDAIQPESKRNEVLGFIRQGLDDVSITRTSIDWGVPVPWAPGHVFYVWYDALINYATAIGLGSDEARFEAWWPAVHHLIGKEIIRFHCVYWPALLLAAGIEPPHRIQVHGWLLLGGEKLSKSEHGPAKLTEIAPAPPRRGLRRRRLTATTSCATSPSGPTASSPTRGWSPASTPTSPTTSATCSAGWRRWAPRSATASGHGPSAGQHARGGRRPSRTPRRRRVVATAAERGARRHLAAHQGGERPPRGERALEGRPGPAVDAVLGDALEVLASSPSSLAATPTTSEEGVAPIGLPGSAASQRCPARRRGALPRLPRGRAGRAALPPPGRLPGLTPCGPTPTATSPTPVEGG
jgi:methionyl-tRNA synthetase